MDYYISIRSFTILPGEESVTFIVAVFRDNRVEKAEFFDMFITDDSVVGAVPDMARFFTQVQIRDSDGRLTVIFHTVHMLHFTIHFSVAIPVIDVYLISHLLPYRSCHCGVRCIELYGH